MDTAVQVKADARPNLCQRKVVSANPKGAKTECLFADGTSILLSNFLATFVRVGDELVFQLGLESVAAGTEIYIRHNPEQRRQDVFQAEIGYATEPRKDKRDYLFISAEIPGSRLGISAIHMRCEALRDYFYVGNRRSPWDRQPAFYELLRVNPKAAPRRFRCHTNYLEARLRRLLLQTALRGRSPPLPVPVEVHLRS
jgi:hypothetical protein